MKNLGPVTLVARWSLGELLWSPRTVAMIAMAGTPLGLALAYRVALAFRMTESGGGAVFSALVSGVFFPFVAPMLSLVYASGVVRDDVEAGTMPYFLTRPLSRSSFLSGKMLASFAMALGLVLPSLVLSYYFVLSPSGWGEVGARFPSLARNLGVAALGLVAYNGIFALAGTVLKRPLLAGLFFIFGWQAIATFVPGRARLATVAHYMSSLTPPSPSAGGFAGLLGERSSTPMSILALAVIAGATHALAIAAFAKKEVR
jgi:ABC-type transport system involved in multi-copper enzyme maturation permease subunit